MPRRPRAAVQNRSPHPFVAPLVASSAPLVAPFGRRHPSDRRRSL